MVKFHRISLIYSSEIGDPLSRQFVIKLNNNNAKQWLLKNAQIGYEYYVFSGEYSLQYSLVHNSNCCKIQIRNILYISYCIIGAKLQKMGKIQEYWDFNCVSLIDPNIRQEINKCDNIWYSVNSQPVLWGID